MGLIPNEIINAVLERSDIVTTIGKYVQLKKAGRNFKALCPFHHEKSPSFVVNPDKQIFHCFGCGAGGNSVGFVMRQEHLEFPQAVRFLADQCGITIPEETSSGVAPDVSKQLRDDCYRVNGLAAEFFHQQLLTSKEPAADTAREYLKKRGVSLATVKQFTIGFAPDAWDGLIKHLKNEQVSTELMYQAGLIIAREKKDGFYDRFRNRVIFPIFDISSRPIAFGARTMIKDEGAKYINSPETPVYTKGRHLFGFNLTKTAAGKLDSVIVVEGYMDMIMPFIHGVENIAASLGTALTPEQIRLIRRYTPNVVMLFDTDPAGQNAMIRSLDLLIDEGMNVRVATLGENQDPDSYIRTYGAQSFGERLNKAVSLFDFKLSWLKSRNNFSTIEGKAHICQSMLATIARYNNEVVKSELLKKLSDDLMIDQDAVRKQMLTVKVIPSKDEVLPVVPSKLRLQDEMFLGILLSDPRWAKQSQEELVVSDFDHPLMQGVITRIWELSSVMPDWHANDLLIRLNDQAMVELVTRLLSKDAAWLGDSAQVFRDCVTKLRKKRLEKKLQEVKHSDDLDMTSQLIKLIKG